MERREEEARRGELHLPTLSLVHRVPSNAPYDPDVRDSGLPVAYKAWLGVAYLPR